MPTSNLLFSASSRFWASSRAAVAASIRFWLLWTFSADGRHLGRDLQLERPKLRLRLLNLQLRASDACLGGAGPDRIAQIQLQVPGRRVEIASVRKVSENPPGMMSSTVPPRPPRTNTGPPTPASP